MRKWIASAAPDQKPVHLNSHHRALKIASKVYHDDVRYDAEMVRTNTIDTFTKALELNRVDFIKVDTEGAESRVISGGLAYDRALVARPLS